MSAALLYAAIFALALVPGLPLGFAVFGRRHLAGWICGAALGYALTALALWIPIRLGAPGLYMFAAAWAMATTVSWLVARWVPQALVPLPAWSRRDTVAWGAVLLLAAAIAIPPLARVGAEDADGNRHYRAYFTADFAWHTALAAELMKFSMPPRNPYLANRPIHYYWTYFLLPAAAAAVGPTPVRDVEICLKVNAVGTAVLFVSAIFIAAWTAVPRAWPVAAAVGLAIVASSAEGAFALWRLWDQGLPLGHVRNLNIDAITSWWFSGLRVDGLPRCFWWVPQHSMAYALGLVALAVVNAAAGGAPLAAIAVAGLALGGSTIMNPFVGGVFSLAWGLAVVVHALGTRDPISRVLRHSVAAVPVALAIGWCAANQMIEGAGGTLAFGWSGQARNSPLVGLLLSLGPALAPAVPGVIAGARDRISSAAVFLAGLSLAALYLVRLNVDLSWVGFRAGQMFIVAVPALAARGLAATGRWRAITAAVALLALLAGLPTTVIDTYNAQDISNVSASPNGPWTITVTRAEHEALEWLRRATPPSTIVQMDPNTRERQTWSLIPSLAQRRMAAGLPISLLDVPEYHEKAAMVKTMYESADAVEAWHIAVRLRIDYIYVDRVERGAYPAGVAKFAASPAHFAPAFRNEEVAIYRVQ
jgi:hypothetical protein